MSPTAMRLPVTLLTGIRTHGHRDDRHCRPTSVLNTLIHDHHEAAWLLGAGSAHVYCNPVSFLVKSTS